MRISLWFRAIAWSTQDGWCNIVDLTGIWLLWDSMIGEFLAEYFFTSKRFWVYNLTKFEWMILNDFECFSFRVIAWWPKRWLMQYYWLMGLQLLWDSKIREGKSRRNISLALYRFQLYKDKILFAVLCCLLDNSLDEESISLIWREFKCCGVQRSEKPTAEHFVKIELKEWHYFVCCQVKQIQINLWLNTHHETPAHEIYFHKLFAFVFQNNSTLTRMLSHIRSVFEAANEHFVRTHSVSCHSG